MKINTSSTFGNFAITAEANVSDALRDALANLGFLQVMQRSPASAAEKALAGYDKRPSGFKRDSIPFSEDNAETLRKNLANMKFTIGEGEASQEFNIDAEVLVTEHIPSVADVKMNDERAAYGRNAGKLDKLASKVGYTGNVGDGIPANAPVEFLRAIRNWTTEQLKSLEV